VPTRSGVACVSGAVAHASASASRTWEISRPMLPRIRAMTSPTSSEKTINEIAPITIHTQTDISHPPPTTGSKPLPAPGCFQTNAATSGLAPRGARVSLCPPVPPHRRSLAGGRHPVRHRATGTENLMERAARRPPGCRFGFMRLFGWAVRRLFLPRAPGSSRVGARELRSSLGRRLFRARLGEVACLRRSSR
jgi:hypothetical protein